MVANVIMMRVIMMMMIVGGDDCCGEDAGCTKYRPTRSPKGVAFLTITLLSSKNWEFKLTN